jgi:hypothetical protein
MVDLITAYRIDNSPYSLDDIIPPAGDHIGTLKGAHLEAEQLLRQSGPQWADWRANYLYVFRDIDWARTYWTLRGPRYLYEVTVNPADVIHIGDMQIFNEIAAATTPEQRAENVRRYRDREESLDQKKIELIVHRATVVRLLHIPEEQAAAHEEWRRRLLGGGNP